MWPGKAGQGVCHSPGQVVQAPGHCRSSLPSCPFLDDPQSSSYLTLLPTLPLDPLVSRLPVPVGKGLFLTLQMPNSIKDKKMNTELGQGPIPSSSV